MKNLIPYNWKRNFKIYLRFWKDRHINFAKNRNREFPKFHSNYPIELEIKKSDFYENKLQNIQLSIQKINEIIILPNETFSFWKVVGNPSKRNGFAKGRNLVNGKVTSSYGGGLCQVSGLLYYLSLKANLNISERHNHSVDIYNDSTRFTPLGTDATVVYGYKDLRIVNNTEGTLKFELNIVNNYLEGRIISTEKLPCIDLFTNINITSLGKEVSLLRVDGSKISVSFYKV
jgi:vancomycin resistance protein VanW